MAYVLTEGERAVLAAFLKNAEADAEGAWNWFHHSITDAVVGVGRHVDDTDAICRSLRKRKLLTGQGQGRWASYYPNDKTRAALTA